MPEYVVSEFMFSVEAYSLSKDCEADIRGAHVVLRYQLKDQEPVTVDTQPAEPPPAPPAEEPEALPEQDPVRILREHGWRVENTKEGTGQPTGFRKRADFQTVSLEYLFPVFCRCKKTGRVSARRMRLRVEYDRATGEPRVTLHASPLGTPVNVYTLDPADEVPTSAHGPSTGDPGMYKVEFLPALPCDGCDSECNVHVNIRYRHPQAGAHKKKKKKRTGKVAKRRSAKRTATPRSTRVKVGRKKSSPRRRQRRSAPSRKK